MNYLGLHVGFKNILHTAAGQHGVPTGLKMFPVYLQDVKKCDSTKLPRTHCTGQFTPKMKANAVSRLLSSLV